MLSNRVVAALLATVISCQCLSSSPARADNPMGYTLLSTDDASGLSRGGGSLGLEVGRAERITNNGLTFDLMKVKAVRSGSAGSRAGFKNGDEIIAVDGRVFPSVAAFAAYLGSMPAGGQVSMDYIPAGGGPQQAQRIKVTLGGAAQTGTIPKADSGLSTREKVAIGVGAAALFGCYKLGCFSRLRKSNTNSQLIEGR